MAVIYEILLTTGEILFFMLTVLAFTVSCMILFKPTAAGNFNARFNEWFSTEKISDEVDTEINTDELVMKYRWFVGGVFLMGALFTLKYLLLDFEQEKFIHLVIDPSGKMSLLFTQMGVEIIKWLMAIVSFFGVIACLTIMFQPEVFKKFNERLTKAFSTKGIQDALDTTSNAVDVWVLKNHVVVGLFLFLGSIFMLVFILKELL